MQAGLTLTIWHGALTICHSGVFQNETVGLRRVQSEGLERGDPRALVGTLGKNDALVISDLPNQSDHKRDYSVGSTQSAIRRTISHPSQR